MISHPFNLLKSIEEITNQDKTKGLIQKVSVSFSKRNIVIIGAGWAGKTIAEELIRSNKFEVVGFFDDDNRQASVELSVGHQTYQIPILDTSKNILNVLQQYNIKEMVIAITHQRKDHLLSEVVSCHEHGIEIHQMPNLYSELTGKVPLTHIDHHWIVPHLTKPKHGFNEFMIFLIDYGTSLFLFFFIFLPLFPFIAIAIKLSSPGPLFFFQKRIGYQGKKFTIYKFRTMTHKARSEGASWTIENDRRITEIGKILRKYRLDELPQLINVLKGDMCLIGPRPEAIDLVATYKKEIPFYEYRYLVKPGITGWAQVKYQSTFSVEGALEKFKYDLYWIKNRSPHKCIQILFRTIKVILTGFGSI